MDYTITIPPSVEDIVDSDITDLIFEYLRSTVVMAEARKAEEDAKASLTDFV